MSHSVLCSHSFADEKTEAPRSWEVVELGPGPTVPALPKACVPCLLLGENGRVSPIGPWPGITLPHVWLSEDMWLPSAYSPVSGPQKVSIYTLSSFSLPPQT